MLGSAEAASSTGPRSFPVLAALLTQQKVPCADLPSRSVPNKGLVIQCKSFLRQDPGGIKPPLLPQRFSDAHHLLRQALLRLPLR